jgi:hypothetical protein
MQYSTIQADFPKFIFPDLGVNWRHWRIQSFHPSKLAIREIREISGLPPAFTPGTRPQPASSPFPSQKRRSVRVFRVFRGSPASVIHCPTVSYERAAFHPQKFTLKIHHFGRKNALPPKLFSLLQTGKKGGVPKVTESLQGFCWGPKAVFTPSFRLHRAKGSFSAYAIIPP